MEHQSGQATNGGAVGRERELALVEECLVPDGHWSGAVITGDAGIGKTSLWEAGAESARKQGYQVLSARPSEEEAQLSFAALADLLEPVETKLFARIPKPQAQALKVVLLRAEPGDRPPPRRVVAAAVLAIIRVLAALAPVLIAVDDAPWLDVPSATTLAFVARRLRLGEGRFLLTRRGRDPATLEQAFEPGRLRRVELGSLSFGALRSVLLRGLPEALPRRAIRQIAEASGGNPLFALELGRMLAERGVPQPGEELPVAELTTPVAGARVRRLSPELRRLLLAAALAPGLTRSQLVRIGGRVVDDGVAAGALVVDGKRVRPAHPLLAAAARAETTTAEQRELHLTLARVVDDEELRARHLALGTDRPDARTAARVAAAADRAASRGAAADAAELAGHAFRLTPRVFPERSERLLTLAERLLVAGEFDDAAELLSVELDAIPSGSLRARAHLLLGQTGFHARGAAYGWDELQKALVESAGHPALRARALAGLSRYLAVGSVVRIEEAERIARDALPAARRAGPAVEREVLHSLALARKLRGLPIDDLVERFVLLSPDAFHLQRGVERIVADRLGTRGHIRDARVAFRRLAALAEERGEGFSSTWLLFQLCELELRAGEWDVAQRYLEESAETSEGVLRATSGYDRCWALLAAGRGRFEEAEQRAAAAVGAAEAGGFRWNLLETLRARGIAALLAHDAERAAQSLGEVWRHTQKEGVDEPAEFPVAPDLVEAHVEVGRFEEARAVTERLRALAVQQEHPWGRASADRCEGLLTLATTREDAALAQLQAAAAAYRELGLRFDYPRTLLAAGRVARRAKKWGAARALLERAHAAFDEIGSEGWADDARAELARIPARRPRPAGELTPSESRVVELAARGLGNKEIAQKLFVTPHTVEVHLSRAYAKLGVRSRAQLAERLRISVI